jgi:phage shock protein E
MPCFSGWPSAPRPSPGRGHASWRRRRASKATAAHGRTLFVGVVRRGRQQRQGPPLRRPIPTPACPVPPCDRGVRIAMRHTMALPVSPLPALAVLAVTLVTADACPLLIDVRTQGEWNADGHASCAHLLPVQNNPALYVPQVMALAGGSHAAQIMTYCRSGGRAGAAQRALQAAGFTNVQNIGGWTIPAGNSAAIEAHCACSPLPPPPPPPVSAAPPSLCQSSGRVRACPWKHSDLSS